MPDKQDIAFGSIQQGSMCMDTLGHFSDSTVGIFACHNTGGNQVRATHWKKTNSHCATVIDVRTIDCVTLEIA